MNGLLYVQKVVKQTESMQNIERFVRRWIGREERRRKEREREREREREPDGRVQSGRERSSLPKF